MCFNAIWGVALPLALCFCLSVAADAAEPTPSAGASAGPWKLVWSDEFNTPGRPDSSKWDYEHGFVRNEELQYYTRDRAENARIEDGSLVIEGRKEQMPNPRYKADSTRWQENRQNAEYTAASLITRGKFSFQYGRVEVRAKLPQGKGVWPAIWTLGVDREKVGWPRAGEIDIMEFVGHDANRVHANVHFFAGGKHSSRGGRIETTAPYNDFHVYAIEWYPDRIDFFFDDKKYHSAALDALGIEGDNPFRKPHYLLINLALGGSWGGKMDDSVLPQKYLIDYVRIYEQAQTK